VIKSHGAQFFTGMDLERALTLPAGYRTSVFRARGGHARNEVYSWYLRLCLAGNDLLYGLLRIEARADAATIRRRDGDERLAPGRTRAHRDAGRALGSACYIYT